MVKQFKSIAGLALIEVVVAMSVLAIAAVGAMGYQYHSARHSLQDEIPNAFSGNRRKVRERGGQQF